MNKKDYFKNTLDKEETVLWQGCSGFNKVKIYAVIICVLSVQTELLIAFALSFISLWFWFVLLLVVPLEIMLIKGTVNISGRNYYCVTDKSLYIYSKQKTQSRYIENIGAITLNKISDKYGDIVFEEKYIEDEENNPKLAEPYGTFSFEYFKDYVAVYAIVNTARLKLRQNLKG